MSGNSIKQVVGKNKRVIFVKPGKKFYIEGVCKFKLIYGKITCFGYTFDGTDSSLIDSNEIESFTFPLISLDSFGILEFSNFKKTSLDESKIKSCFEKVFSINGEEVAAYVKTMVSSSYNCAILLEPYEPPCFRVFHKISSKFYENSKFSSVQVYLKSEVSSESENTSKNYMCYNGWDDVVNLFLNKHRNSRLTSGFLSCGQKSSGKSTLNKYVANKLLSLGYTVYWLDCDIGQSELFPCGCVSLFTVSLPLFGPPFSHMYPQGFKTQPPLFSRFLGDNSPAKCLLSYIEAIKQAFNAYCQIFNAEKKCALIVNTQGWVEETGQDLLLDIIRITSPCLIVQLSHSDSFSNFDINMDIIKNSSGLGTQPKDNTQELLNVAIGQLVTKTVTAYGNKNNFVAMSPQEFRYCSFIEYFFNSYGEYSIKNCVPLSNIQDMFNSYAYIELKWDDYFLNFTTDDIPVSYILESLPRKVVALCSLTIAPKREEYITISDVTCEESCMRILKNSSIINCIGQGVIRNVDIKRRSFYVITPLLLSLMEQVKVISIGYISIPDCFIHKTRPQLHSTFHGQAMKRRRKLPFHND